MSNEVIRQLDSKGRMTLPKQLLDKMGAQAGGVYVVTYDEATQAIVIKPFKPQ